MRSKVSIVLLACLVFVSLLSVFVFAQDIGCCCDPVVRNGSFSSRDDCVSKSFVFVGPPSDITVTCSEHCNATFAQDVEGVCGDNICQPGETETGCPSDCGPKLGCGSPDFRPAPTNLFVTPVRSRKELRLNFGVPCPAEFLVVSRCEGRNCDDFKEVARVPPQNYFIDSSNVLEFNKDYTYRVVAHYLIVGPSEPAEAVGNAGDVECLDQAGNVFCITPGYYDNVETYLKEFGYGYYTGEEFVVNFNRAVRDTFATRFNKAWECNAANRLTQETPVDCMDNEVCVADEQGARCATPVDCESNFDKTLEPFGLFFSVQSCEGIFPRYCFFDKSISTPDDCYSCNPQMSCFDYKTEGACRRDNCNAGDCSWVPVFDDLGLGVCVDERESNCKWCTVKGTRGLGTNDVQSAVFESCSEEKSNALSTDDFPCFFDRDKKVSKGCEFATCADYTRGQCASPAGGIRLNRNNEVIVPSADPCGIGVCEYQTTTGCIKNADGNAGAGFQDCKFGNVSCEQDYFPPSTIIVPAGVAGRSDKLQIRIFDQLSKFNGSKEMTSRYGYKTVICIKSGSNSCEDARDFSLETTSSELLVKNLELKDGNKTLGRLALGNNTLRYYSKDAANNVEKVKEVTFYACRNCQGPTLLDMEVTAGRKINDSLYTAVSIPTFTLIFDEPMVVTYADLRSSEGSVPLVQLTQGMREVHEFRVGSALNGSYVLGINGRNEKQVYIEPPGLQIPVFVNVDKPEVKILPVEGSILNVSTVDAVLNFSSKVSLVNVSLVLESFADQYVKKSVPKDVTNDFSVENDTVFSASLSDVKGGKYSIVVNAVGFNGLPVEGSSSFFVGTLKPSIRLVEPSFGVTSEVIFDANVETPLPSTCAYVFNTPTPPSDDDFQFFNKFDGNRFFHTVSGIQVPDSENFLLHAYCSFEKFGIAQRTFNITFDAEPPVIKKSFAAPSVVSEEYLPGSGLYVTRLMVELDKPGFCKWSSSVPHFRSMEGKFPGFNTVPKKSLFAEVNVSRLGQHSFFVACKGLNDLLTPPETITFNVDLTVPLKIESATPQGSPTANFSLGVVANKRVFCYYGDNPDDVTECMGDCSTDYAHHQEVSAPGEGRFDFYARCADLAGKISEVIEIPVLIDSSPPQMEFVNDESTLNNSDISTSEKRLRVAFKGSDAESGISHYLVSLKNLDTKEFVFQEVVSNATDGEHVYFTSGENNVLFSLEDGAHYQFIVKAVNGVFLESSELESDGVLIDTSLQALACDNSVEDPDETDVDCGGVCEVCEPGQKCLESSDCATGFCSSGICEITSCEDDVKNGVETDVDCGGLYCNPCSAGQKCIVNSDCATKYCDKHSKVCVKAPICENQELDQGETDVDCGGSCKPCTEGKTCNYDSDCEGLLRCSLQKACTSESDDKDMDGVYDSEDECPNTPPGEEVDEKGCSASQRYTLGDSINDNWRLDNFGCLTCPEASIDADPDDDGLTNEEEFAESTSPVSADSDGDGWNDGKEVKEGFSPVDPSSHPASKLRTLLWVLFILLAFAGVAYGVFILLQMKREGKKELPKLRYDRGVSERPTAFSELRQLRTLADREGIPKEEWAPVAEKIKKKPLPDKKFNEALDRLKRMARSKTPVERLQKILADVPKSKKEKVVAKYDKLADGSLSAGEREKLLDKLRTTAGYVSKHKKEIKKELKKHEK